MKTPAPHPSRRARPRISVVRAVFRREWVDSLRDFDTTITTFGLPLFTWVLSAILCMAVLEQFTFMNWFQSGSAGAKGASAGEVAKPFRMILVEPEPSAIGQAIRERSPFRIVTMPEEAEGVLVPEVLFNSGARLGDRSTWSPEFEAMMEASQSLIQDEAADLVVVTRRVADAPLERFRIYTLYLGVKLDSRQAQSELFSFLRKENQAEGSRRLEGVGLDREAIQPYRWQSVHVGNWGDLVYVFAGRLFPLLLIAFAAASAYTPTVSAIAGEKEGGTLATLASSPLRPSEVILGKFANIVVFGLMGAVTYFLPILVAIVAGKFLLPDLGFSLLPWLLALLCILPASMIYAALAMAVVSCGSSYKLSQALLVPFMFMFLFPASVCLLPDVELTPQVALVPLASLSLLIRALLDGSATGWEALITAFSNFAYAGIALTVAMRVIRIQSGGLAGELSFKEALTRRVNGGLQPNSRLSLGLFMVLLVGSVFVQVLILRLPLHVQIPLVLGLVVVGIPILVSRWLGLPWKQCFWFRWPSWRGWLGAGMIGLGSWAVTVLFYSLMGPPPEEWTRALARPLLEMVQAYPWPVLFLLLAILPAVCEELTFRGVIFRGFLNSRGPWAAIIGSAFCFGLMHLSLFRMFPTFVLGVLAGYAAWKTRSLWPAILIHLLNNGMVVLSLVLQPGAALGAENPDPVGQWVFPGMGLALMAGGVVILARMGK